MSKYKPVNEYGCLENNSGIMDDEKNELSVYAVVNILNGLYEDNKKLYERIMSIHQEYGQMYLEIYGQNDYLGGKSNRLTNKINKKHDGNDGIQKKVLDLLDFVEDKGSVTRVEIKEWWDHS